MEKLDKQILLGVVILFGFYYLKNKTVQTVKDVGEAINPVNKDNIFNQGFESLLGAVAGSDKPMDIYDFINQKP